MRIDVDLCSIEMKEKGRTILFDGVCNLCDGFVQFIIKRDHKEQFKFGALQSVRGVALLDALGVADDKLDSVVYVRDGNLYKKSQAVLLILSDMGGIWSIARPLKMIPTPISDWVYDRVAQNRYRIFGKKEECMIPTPELRARFIEN